MLFHLFKILSETSFYVRSSEECCSFDCDSTHCSGEGDKIQGRWVWRYLPFFSCIFHKFHHCIRCAFIHCQGATVIISSLSHYCLACYPVSSSPPLSAEGVQWPELMIVKLIMSLRAGLIIIITIYYYHYHHHHHLLLSSSSSSSLLSSYYYGSLALREVAGHLRRCLVLNTFESRSLSSLRSLSGSSSVTYFPFLLLPH